MVRVDLANLARLGREIRGREIVSDCAAAALHIANKDNTIADAPSRFSIKASGGNQFPDREPRPKFCAVATRPWGTTDADMMSDDKGLNARAAFEGPSPRGQLLWVPRVDLIDMALYRIRMSMRE